MMHVCRLILLLEISLTDMIRVLDSSADSVIVNDKNCCCNELSAFMAAETEKWCCQGSC